jgi:hypothetical protein
MYFLKGNKDILIKIFEKDINYLSKFIKKTDSFPNVLLLDKEFLCIWKNNPNEISFIPELIVLKEIDIRDLLAWILTYSKIKPLTSISRITSFEYYSEIKNNNQYRINKDLNYQKLFVSLVICEGLTNLNTDDSLSLTINYLKNTYSFIKTRLFCVYNNMNIFDTNNDNEVWSFIEQSVFSDNILTLKHLRKFWTLINDFYLDKYLGSMKKEYPRNENEFYNNTIRKGYIDRDFLVSLVGIPGFEINDFLSLNTNLENKVILFERFVNIIDSEISIPMYQKDIIIGFLCSKLSNGSLEHFILLKFLINRYPLIILWYGFFSSFIERSNIFMYNNGLGLRLLKAINEDFDLLNDFNYDFSYEEFKLLNNSKDRNRIFNMQNIMRIELFPGIVFTLLKKEKTNSDTVKSRDFLADQRLMDQIIKNNTKINELMDSNYNLFNLINNSIKNLKKKREKSK